jgi:hypothetical protein
MNTLTDREKQMIENLTTMDDFNAVCCRLYLSNLYKTKIIPYLCISEILKQTT